MKNVKFSDAQILAILHQAENGVPVSELCRYMARAARFFTNGTPSLAEWMPV